MALEKGIGLGAAIVWTAGAAALLTALLIVTVLYGVPLYLCGNTMGPIVASPDGRHRAVIFERDCGGPTPRSTQVSILRADETQWEGDAGNAYMSTPDLSAVDAPPRGTWGGPWVALRWTDNRHLLIARDPRQTDDFVAPSVDGVHIRIVATRR